MAGRWREIFISGATVLAALAIICACSDGSVDSGGKIYDVSDEYLEVVAENDSLRLVIDSLDKKIRLDSLRRRPRGKKSTGSKDASGKTHAGSSTAPQRDRLNDPVPGW